MKAHTELCKRNKINLGYKGKEIVENIDDASAVIQQFKLYSNELLEKHDRMERVRKLSHDLTIESKRLIFLLHTIDKESKQENILNEAKQRLENVSQFLLKSIAKELENEEPHQYLKVYRSGLEEYVEAATFYQYLRYSHIQDWNMLQKEITQQILDRSKTDPTESISDTRTASCTLLTPHKYILGIADLTGELMRRCVNNLATADIENCYQTCSFVREIYKGFLACTITYDKELNRKLYTLQQNLQKIEYVCYTIKVRGSEIPKHMLVDAAIEEIQEDQL